MKKNTVWAVLPAAGLSRRMHRFKPLLPLGEKTILEQTISRFQEAGIKKIVVVTGHWREEIAPLLERLEVLEVWNPDYAVSDMFCSVQLGIRAVFEREKPAAVLVSPGDSPLIRPFTITQVLESARESETSAVIPCFKGQDGHPPLLSGDAAEALLRYEGEGGLRGFIASLADVCRIDTVDAGMLLDADTPRDYERLQAWYQNWEIPDREVCQAIWNCADTPGPVRKHCQKVSEISRKAADRILKAVPSEEQDRFQRLVQAGALLHDVMRTSPEHELAGKRLLQRIGYHSTAEVVDAHRTGPSDFLGLGEPDWEQAAGAIVYCADRLTLHDRQCSYHQRYENKRREFQGNPKALEKLERDRERFWQCREKLKELAGYDLFE